MERNRERDGRWTAERWTPHGHVSVIRSNSYVIVIAHQSLQTCTFLSLDATYRYAASIDDILEEEEHYADQLKEYLFYTDAVR